MATMLQSPILSALAGIRHGFFTRTGGVSTGCYESLNGGVGSNDTPAHVAENRARMASAVGVSPERLISAYQIHSPAVVTGLSLAEVRPEVSFVSFPPATSGRDEHTC